LINAAGVASMNLALMTPAKTAEHIVRTNLLGTIFCCQQFAPLMIRNRSGVIVNFSTIAVSLGLEGESVYCASKAGVESFSRVFAREVSAFNVRVNCVAPGPIQTDLIRGVPDEKISQVVHRQIARKMFSKEELCDFVDLVLSDHAKGMTGQVLHLGGA
jgi:3-oxoacyl-[acyl-carrier protein] reductase